MNSKNRGKYEVVKLDEVEIHELAHLTPTMTDDSYKALKLSLQEHGQEMPIIMYRGKCIDGRHRVKALRELEIESAYYINEDSQLSIDDLRDKILNVYECRRHQTPTQKAIMAYREYTRLKDLGEKVGQGEVAKWTGTTIKQIGRVKQLHNSAGDDIIELLFQGNRINIGTEHNPNHTDSLYSLINYFKKHKEMIIEQTETTKISEDYTDEEIASLNMTVERLQAEYSVRMLNRLNNLLYVITNKTKVGNV